MRRRFAGRAIRLVGACVVAGLVVSGALCSSVQDEAYGATPPVTTTATTPPPGAPTPGTTLVPIRNQLPAPPVTLPLTTRPASTHVDPILAKLSLAGFALCLLLLLLQLVLTRPRRRRRWTL